MQEKMQYYAPVCQKYQYRVLIYQANGLIGHRLVEYFRNDHVIEVNPNVIAGTLKKQYNTQNDLQLDITVDVNNNPLLNSVIASSDIILFPLNKSNTKQLQYLLKFLKCLSVQNKKKVIVFSSIFSWKARVKGNMIKKQDYSSRKIIDSAVKQLQNMTLGINHINNKIQGCVISCGVVYGMGEETLFEQFKQALQQKQLLNIYGRGVNYIPTIHVDDLSQFAYDIAFSDQSGFHLAVDHSNVTQRQLVQTISKTLGNGKVNEVSIQEGFLDDNFDIFSADIMLDPKSLPKISTWKSRGGIVANIGTVVGEFNTSRGLKPNKIVIHGAPASGKSQLAHILSKNYGLPVLTIKGIVDEVKAEDSPFATQIKGILQELKAVRIQEQRKIYQQAKKKKKGKGMQDFDPQKVVPRLQDKQIQKILKRRLNMSDCLNKGYIIDGILKTYNLCQSLFIDENGQQIQSIMPNSIFNIQATEQQVKQRIKKLPVETTQGTHWNQEQTVRRYGVYKGNNQGKKWVEFFDGKVQVYNVPFQYQDTKQFIQFVERNGPLGFKPRVQEQSQQLVEQKKQHEQVKQEKDEQGDKLEQQQSQQEEEGFDLQKLTQNQTKILNQKSRPIRQYLIDNVIPQITQGLLQICKQTPPDPIKYLINFLQTKKSRKKKRKP